MKLFRNLFPKEESVIPITENDVWIKDGKSRCTQCNCILPDEDKSICQYTISNKRVCKKHFEEISEWSGKGWKYKQWDEIGAKKYPKIYTENNFYKKIGKYR